MLTLLHTNDLHNHLSDAQADTLRSARNALGTSGLLLDAGDAVASGNITYRPGGETIFAKMNRAGYDAMTVGNREFHLLRRGFHSKVSGAAFPVLCANVRPSGQSPTEQEAEALLPDLNRSDPPVRPYQVFSCVDTKATPWCVLIIGVTVPMITPRMLVRKVSAYVFDDPLTTMERLLPDLQARYRPDLMIALTHIGLGRDRELAVRVPALDLIVGGHTHERLATGERVGETLIVQADCFGHYVGRVEVQRNAGHRCVMTAGLEPLL